jgi:hypothetical protein
MLKAATSPSKRGQAQRNQNMAGEKIARTPSARGHKQGREGSASTTGSTGYVENAAAREDEQWLQDMVILRRAAADRMQRRMAAKVPFPWVATDGSPPPFADPLEYSSAEEQNAIVRSFYEHNPDQAASLLNVALRESSPGQRSRIGVALVSSGLVSDAINNLTSKKKKDTYRAFSLLFLAAKAGQIEPLVQVIETHASVELRLKLIGLLVSSGERESLEALRRLAVSKSLPPELRSMIVEAIDQLNAQTRETAPSAA